MNKKAWVAKGHTIEELRTAQRSAFSMNDREDILELVGHITQEEKILKIYKDQTGNYWYSSFFRINGKVISEEEKIFGKKFTRKSRNNCLDTMRQQLKKG